MFKRITIILAALFLVVACGAKDDGHDDGSYESGDCAGGGWCGDESIVLSANLANAKALFTMQSSETSASIVSDKTVGAELEQKAVVGTQSRFYKLLDNGEYESVLSAWSESKTDAYGDLPLISFIAMNSLGDVFVVYQHPFRYREYDPDTGISANEYSDPWSPSSPYTCQIFKMRASLVEANDNSAENDYTDLECITTSYEIDTWDFRSGKMQFDDAGNAYFSAHRPQNWQNVLLRWNRSTESVASTYNDITTYTYADYEDSEANENDAITNIINKYICFREWVVTPSGGVLYAGITSTNGSCDGDSFLRYATSASGAQEITSGWWDYTFQTVGTEDTLAGIDASLALDESASSERVIFYGPNPLVATTPDWDDTCLYMFDPNLSGQDRSTEVADCSIDIWRWINYDSEGASNSLSVQKDRCDDVKYMMGGGNRPKKIILSDSFSADGNYIGDASVYQADGNKEIFVVGNIFSKTAGEWRYDVCIDEAHCLDSNDVPDYDYNGNQGGCEAVSGNTWKTYGDCYNQMTDSDFYTVLTSGDAADDDKWRVNGQWCEMPGGDWRDTYSAFARVNYTDEDTRSIDILSSTNEIVKNGWEVNDRLYYVAFNVDEGVYKLIEVGNGGSANNVELLSDYEVYELFRHPTDSDLLYFNGFKFADNEYVIGYFDPDVGADSLQVQEGIEGQIETLVIIPDELLQ